MKWSGGQGSMLASQLHTFASLASRTAATIRPSGGIFSLLLCVHRGFPTSQRAAIPERSACDRSRRESRCNSQTSTAKVKNDGFPRQLGRVVIDGLAMAATLPRRLGDTSLGAPPAGIGNNMSLVMSSGGL
jgi:hypothetical protein